MQVHELPLCCAVRGACHLRCGCVQHHRGRQPQQVIKYRLLPVCWHQPELQASPEHLTLVPIPEQEDEQDIFLIMNAAEPQAHVSWLILSLLGQFTNTITPSFIASAAQPPPLPCELSARTNATPPGDTTIFNCEPSTPP
jgi:hypothetical protein